MKPPSTLLLLALASLAHAQYFSEGWKPGQQPAAHGTKGVPPPAAAYTPGASPPDASSSGGGLAGMLSSGPIGSLLARAGLNLSATPNITELDVWDPRVQLITDDNWDELIVNEKLTKEEEERRTWFLVMCACFSIDRRFIIGLLRRRRSSTTLGTQTQGGLSKIMDREFDAAFNETMIAQDLPDVRWGRIDYLNVTYLTTKWNIWSYVLPLLPLHLSSPSPSARYSRVNLWCTAAHGSSSPVTAANPSASTTAATSAPTQPSCALSSYKRTGSSSSRGARPSRLVVIGACPSSLDILKSPS